MIGLEGKRLTTDRLSVRLLEAGDRQALAALLSDAEVTRPAGFLPAKDEEEFQAFYEALTRYNAAMAVLRAQTLIGYCHVNPYRTALPGLEGKKCVGLGFVIGRPFQRRGYGTEMLQAVTGYLLGRFDACFADCFAENQASKGLIERCGYRFVEEYSMLFTALGEEKRCLSFIKQNG